MYPPPLENLIELFQKFPGIGPRQAGRFAHFLFKQERDYCAALAEEIRLLHDRVRPCGQCFRATPTEGRASDNAPFLCAFCADARRNPRAIAIVEKESDMRGLERTAEFNGLYHILGGVLSPLDDDSPKRLRLGALYERVNTLLASSAENCEVILATNSTTEGDTTALYIERILEPLATQYQNLSVSRLGRGLSLGAELEYSDDVTIRHALKNRSARLTEKPAA
ncbi:MAG: recombination mediator RecR [Patescibacteria group bacterium]